MAEYKKQHYIPQFYLRNFSTDRRRVCLFLLAQKKPIRDVNIKGQCVRDYFYSKDIEVEKALSGLIEGPAHIAIARLLKTGHLPAAESDDMAKLLSFVLTLQGRTLAASNAMEEMTEHFGKHVIEAYTQASGKYTADQLKGIRMRLTQPALMSLVIATQMLPLVMDLKPALLTTNQRGLITSDNPVVAVNPYMQGVWDGSNTGSASAGLQVILPISPQAALFFYDDEIYELVVAAEPSVTLSKEDVETLNLLQMANAEHAVYFD